MNIEIDFSSTELIKGLNNEEKAELFNDLWNSIDFSFHCDFVKKHLNLLAYSDLDEEMHKRGY